MTTTTAIDAIKNELLQRLERPTTLASLQPAEAAAVGSFLISCERMAQASASPTASSASQAGPAGQ